MENTLITSAQVICEAFRTTDFVREESVLPADILSAEQKYLVPVLGGLYKALQNGLYPQLMSDYIVKPLALYVKAQMLPRLWLQSSDAGIVRLSGSSLASASESQLREMVGGVLQQAHTLMLRAVEHIESSEQHYPEYDSRKNVLNHCSIRGGIVVTSAYGTDL